MLGLAAQGSGCALAVGCGRMPLRQEVTPAAMRQVGVCPGACPGGAELRDLFSRGRQASPPLHSVSNAFLLLCFQEIDTPFTFFEVHPVAEKTGLFHGSRQIIAIISLWAGGRCSKAPPAPSFPEVALCGIRRLDADSPISAKPAPRSFCFKAGHNAAQRSASMRDSRRQNPHPSPLLDGPARFGPSTDSLIVSAQGHNMFELFFYNKGYGPGRKTSSRNPPASEKQNIAPAVASEPTCWQRA